MDTKTITDKNNLLKYFRENKVINLSIDRFTEDFAVCEDITNEEMINIIKELIPEKAIAGDILIIKNDILIIDKKTTRDQQKEVKSLVDQLFKSKS